MNILIGCEESQTVCNAFRLKGHNSFSCDIEETRGNHEYHFKCDIFEGIDKLDKWDLIILHPDCTAMAVSGNRWYGKGMDKHQSRIDAIEWTLNLWRYAKLKSNKVCLENPVSIIFTYINDAKIQYIQPWQFGHGETKKTGLALYNLPLLIPDNIVSGREQRIFKMPPSPTRKRDRSKTYQGIANAMANQWG